MFGVHPDFSYSANGENRLGITIISSAGHAKITTAIYAENWFVAVVNIMDQRAANSTQLAELNNFATTKNMIKRGVFQRIKEKSCSFFFFFLFL